MLSKEAKFGSDLFPRAFVDNSAVDIGGKVAHHSVARGWRITATEALHNLAMVGKRLAIVFRIQQESGPGVLEESLNQSAEQGQEYITGRIEEGLMKFAIPIRSHTSGVNFGLHLPYRAVEPKVMGLCRVLDRTNRNFEASASAVKSISCRTAPRFGERETAPIASRYA
jgi:hypothetical protein